MRTSGGEAMTTIEDVLAGRAKWCVEHSRCEAFSSALPDGSVNLLWLDPPYFRVVDEEWDRAWKTEADFLVWLRSIVAEAARVLAPNGSLYLFASPQMGGRVECIAREHLDVLNHLVWAKRQGWHAKAEEEALRGYFPQTERVIFAGHAEPAESPMSAAIRVARERAGLTRSALDVAIGRTSAADPTRGTGLVYRWEEGSSIPTASDFARVMRVCGGDQADFAALVRAADAARRPFAADLSAHTTDVWTYETVTPTPQKHPCEKPETMLRDVVRCSSRPGDVVCEFFGGSFRMAEVALSEGRRYIGCDADEHWARVGVERARAAERGTVAAVPSRRTKATRDEALPLFGGVR